MPRHKAIERINFPAWLVGNKDGKERVAFLRLPSSLVRSKNFQDLSYASQLLYERMNLEAMGKCEVEFTEKTAKKYGFPSATFSRSKRELINSGYIAQVDNEDLAQYKPCKFRFLTDWKLGNTITGENKKPLRSDSEAQRKAV